MTKERTDLPSFRISSGSFGELHVTHAKATVSRQTISLKGAIVEIGRPVDEKCSKL